MAARAAGQVQKTNSAGPRVRLEQLTREDGLESRLPVVPVRVQREIFLSEPARVPGVALSGFRHAAS